MDENVSNQKPIKNRKKLSVFFSILLVFLSVIALAIALVVLVVYREKVSLGWIIGGPILAGYCVLADIYCMSTGSYISDVFLEVASWSIKFPGLIFSLSFDELFKKYGCPDFDCEREKEKLNVLTLWGKITKKGVERPVIDQNKCVKCGQCVEHCPVEGKAVTFKNGKDNSYY